MIVTSLALSPPRDPLSLQITLTRCCACSFPSHFLLCFPLLLTSHNISSFFLFFSLTKYHTQNTISLFLSQKWRCLLISLIFYSTCHFATNANQDKYNKFVFYFFFLLFPVSLFLFCLSYLLFVFLIITYTSCNWVEKSFKIETFYLL